MRDNYSEQLLLLNKKMTELGELCETVIELATIALLAGDSKKAGEVQPIAQRVDQLEREIETFCLKLLLHQQPCGEGGNDHIGRCNKAALRRRRHGDADGLKNHAAEEDAAHQNTRPELFFGHAAQMPQGKRQQQQRRQRITQKQVHLAGHACIGDHLRPDKGHAPRQRRDEKHAFIPGRGPVFLQFQSLILPILFLSN